MRVSKLGKTLEIVAETILMRDPRNGDHAGLSIDMGRKMFGVGPAVDGVDNTHLDAFGLLERFVENVGCLVVQIVDDDIVPRLQVECFRYDVLAFARREEK